MHGTVRCWLLGISLALISAGSALAQDSLPSPVSLGQQTRSRDETFTISIMNGPADVQRAVIRLARNGNVYSRDALYAAPAAGRAEAIVTSRIDAAIPLGKYAAVVELDGQPFPVSQKLEIVPPGNPDIRLNEFAPADTDKVELAYFDDAHDKPAEATQVARLVLRGSGFQADALKGDNVFVINGVREPVTWEECPRAAYGNPDKPQPRKIVAQVIGSERIDLCLVPVPSNGEIRVQLGLGDRLSETQAFRVFEMVRGTVVTFAALIALALALLPLLLLRTLRRSYAISDQRYRLRLLFLDPETDTYSLSKLQFYLWTVAALFAYAYLFISRVIVQYASWPDVPGTLPGIIAVAAGTSIASQLVTTTKGSKGSGTERPGITDFITSGGVVAPDRLQMLLWTIFGVGAFLVVVLEQHPGRITDLPAIPEGLLYLMGLSSAGYLGGKMARKPGPVINEISITPADSDEAILRAAQPVGSELPDLTRAITNAQAELSALTEPAAEHARTARTHLSNAIGAVNAAQTTTEVNQLMATLVTLRAQAEKVAIAAAQEFAAGTGTPEDAMTAQNAAAALQELSADVTQAIAIGAALPMATATAPTLIARTIALRGTNLSTEALLEIDHADLPFRMLINAEGQHGPDILVREQGVPTLARVMRLTIDPAILCSADFERFQTWFRAGGERTFTLTNPDGQKAELNFSLPPGEAQKGGTAQMNELQKETARAIVNVFETGRIRGNYSEIAVIKGDSGHLSYGRSQAALGAGSLYELIDFYCLQPNARFADELRAQLPRFQAKDVSLDTDDQVKGLLKAAGAQDPVMRVSQDQFFNRNYFAPACRAAEALGINEALGQTVIYDSHIQGGWGVLKKRIGPVTARGERDWVQRFIVLRAEWLKSLKPPLPNTVYRMDSFGKLIAQKKWDLALPLAVHGVTITAEALGGDIPAPEVGPRTLQLASPYLRGADVSALQRELSAKGLQIPADGVYGPFTDVMVKKWQAQQNINEVGAGKQTRASLGL